MDYCNWQHWVFGSFKLELSARNISNLYETSSWFIWILDFFFYFLKRVFLLRTSCILRLCPLICTNFNEIYYLSKNSSCWHWCEPMKQNFAGTVELRCLWWGKLLEKIYIYIYIYKNIYLHDRNLAR